MELPESLIQSWQHLTVQLLMARNSAAAVAISSVRMSVEIHGYDPTISQKIPGDSQLQLLWNFDDF